MFVIRRQRQSLAEPFERLVGRETGPERGDLEEHAARLAEVDRLEPEAVDDRRRVRARVRDALSPGRVILDGRRPGDVMDGPRALQPSLRRRRVVRIERAAAGAARFPLVVAAWLEAERLLEKAAAPIRLLRVGAHGVESLQRKLGGNLGMLA